MRRGHPLEITWEEDADELYERYRAEKNIHRRNRLHILWLTRAGKSLTEASQVVGVPYSTARRWMDWYRSGGLEEVLRRTPGHAVSGTAPYLKIEQVEVLRAKADSGAFRTAREVQKWIAHQWEVSYTRPGIYALFRRMKVTWKVPRRQAEQADPEEQAAWKKGASTPA